MLGSLGGSIEIDDAVSAENEYRISHITCLVEIGTDHLACSIV